MKEIIGMSIVLFNIINLIDFNKNINIGGRVVKRSEVAGQKVGGSWTEGRGSKTLEGGLLA